MIPQTSKQTLRKGTFYKDPKRQSLRLTNKQKIEIIEFYICQKSNSVKEICIYFNISIDRANTLINDYLSNNSLILESKINNEIE